MIRLIPLALALAGLAACTAAPAATTGGSTAPPATAPAAALPATFANADLVTVLTNLKTKTVADLTAAEADATANGDAISQPCYPAEITWINSLPAVPSLTLPGPTTANPSPGPILLYQQARDTRHSVESLTAQIKTALAAGIPTSVKLGCAALLIDEQTFFNKLLTLAGGAAAMNALAPLAPAAGAALPTPFN